MDTYSPHPPFDGEMAERFNATACKAGDRNESERRRSDPRVRIPLSPPNCFERTLTRFELVFALLIPVRRFTGRANSRLADSALARFPFMGTTITFITFSFERDHAHAANILDNNILSRFTFPLTNIYLFSNIFLR